MTFWAAEDLQKLHYQNRHFERGHKNTQKSLRLAVCAIFVNAFFAVGNLVIGIINLFKPA